MSDKESFKKELKTLLKKYNVSIWADYGGGSDTHGIYDEAMIISTLQSHNKASWEIRVDGWDLSAGDL